MNRDVFFWLMCAVSVFCGLFGAWLDTTAKVVPKPYGLVVGIAVMLVVKTVLTFFLWLKEWNE